MDRRRTTRITLSAQDHAVWSALAAGIKRLRAGPEPLVKADTATKAAPVSPPQPADSAPPPLPGPPPSARPHAARLASVTVGTAPGGLDRGSWQRLRTGSLPVERRLDLHGMTAQLAFRRFEQVLALSVAEGLRCIEVITGRGSGEQGGVLRRELPLWLNLPHLRPLILAASHPHEANTGSVRLLLRRPSRAPGLPRSRR